MAESDSHEAILARIDQRLLHIEDDVRGIRSESATRSQTLHSKIAAIEQKLENAAAQRGRIEATVDSHLAEDNRRFDAMRIELADASDDRKTMWKSAGLGGVAGVGGAGILQAILELLMKNGAGK